MNSIMSNQNWIPYTGSIDVGIDPTPNDDPGQEKKCYQVTVETERLQARTIQSAQDIERYTALFSSPENMATYGAGLPLEGDMIHHLVKTWEDRWKQGNPYSGVAIFTRNVSGVEGGQQFVGHGDFKSGTNNRAFGKEEEVGSAEFTGVIDKEFWHKGFGKEAAAALVNGLAPRYQKEGFKVVTAFEDGTQKRLPLERLLATISKSNENAIKIVTGLGFEYQGTVKKTFMKGSMEKYYYAKDVPLSNS